MNVFWCFHEVCRKSWRFLQMYFVTLTTWMLFCKYFLLIILCSWMYFRHILHGCFEYRNYDVLSVPYSMNVIFAYNAFLLMNVFFIVSYSIVRIHLNPLKLGCIWWPEVNMCFSKYVLHFRKIPHECIHSKMTAKYSRNCIHECIWLFAIF